MFFREKLRQNWAFAAAIPVFLFQLFTLNLPALNGDEAVYCLLKEEVQKLLSGHLPSANPLIGYSGPLDFWLMGSVYWVAGLLHPSGEAGPWLVRVVPFLIAWAGILRVYFVLRRTTENTADFWLFTASVAPMFLIYSRSAFPHSFFLGLFSFLFAEALLIEKGSRLTGWVQALRIALISGLAVEANTTAFFGVLVTFLPVGRPLFRWIGKNRISSAISFLVFFLLAYSVLKNFPPPAGLDSERGQNPFLEFLSFLSMVTGRQPIIWLMHQDPAPIWASLVFLVFLLYATGAQFRVLRQKRNFIFRVWMVTFLSSVFLGFLCFRGRSLRLVGHERYFLSLVPLWTFLWADALRRLKNGKALAVLMGGFVFLRVALPVLQYSKETDPTLLAARWLQENCPPSQCVAVAEEFWNYWPFRYYTRDGIDLHLYLKSWKNVPVPKRQGRRIAGCWYLESEHPYLGKFSEKVIFPAQFASRGQVCFKDIDFEF